MAIRRFKRPFRRFRRKRGNQGTWFPTAGSSWSESDLTWYDAGFTLNTLSLDESKADGPTGICIPVTKDFTQQPTNSFGLLTGPSLRDEVEGQSYLLKRLVGNLHLQYGSDGQGSDPTQYWRQALVSAGFFVARSVDTSEGAVDLDFDEWDPLQLDNIQNPWIWRRTWILSNPEGNVVRDDFPIANSNYVGDMSGPHFDTKSKRRITREQRLWFALTAIGWDGDRISVSSVGPGQGSIHGYLDLRIFGKMMRGKNHSAF